MLRFSPAPRRAFQPAFALHVTRGLSGQTTGQSNVSGLVDLAGKMMGAVPAVSSADGALNVTWVLEGLLWAEGAAVGVLPVARNLVGSLTAQSSVSGRLLTPLSGSIAASSSVAAALSLAQVLAGAVAAQSSLAPLPLVRFWPPMLSLPEPTGQERRISWATDEVVLVVIDGELYQQASGGETLMHASQVIRQYLDIVDEAPHTPHSPLDRAALAWAGDDVKHHIMRRLDGGEWEQVVETHLFEHTDGPLMDGSYDYKAVAVDEEGDTAESSIANVTISSAPEPPSGLSWSWNSELKRLTLSWNASPSSDVATYRVRSSAGEAELDLSSVPVQDTADLTYVQDFTTETGMSVFSVRAVDADGNEEANLSQAVAIPFENGAPAARPAEPLMVEAEAVSGGKIRVSWLYDPLKEYLGPGAAYEARIYWNNGTGTVDYDTPKATLALNNPTKAARYSWESEALTHGQQYRFVVRIATTAHPAGVETSNTDEHAATADTDVPQAPILSVEIV